MTKKLDKQISWLLPVVLILFILEAVTLPFVIDLAYADRADSPEHVITYTQNSLIWDSTTGVDSSGAAKLSLFETLYDNTESENGDKIIAPGTGGKSSVRLKNASEGKIEYTAVLYTIKSSDLLPVAVSLDDGTFADTDFFQLPDGVLPSSVIGAVTGELQSGQIQDFDISWVWEFSIDDARDIADTTLGDLASDDITVGLYVTVNDEGNLVVPSPPETGDDTLIGVYIALMLISGILLIVLIVTKIRNKNA